MHGFAERTIAQRSLWTHPMVLLGHEAQMDDRFGIFGDCANLMQNRCTVCVERTIGSKSFWAHPIEYLGGVGHVVSHFGPFGYSVSISAR
jgi:hypothetical protein